jgi:hypothetical protein
MFRRTAGRCSISRSTGSVADEASCVAERACPTLAAPLTQQASTARGGLSAAPSWMVSMRRRLRIAPAMGFDARETCLLTESSQLGHRQLAGPADIHGAKQGDVSGHGQIHSHRIVKRASRRMRVEIGEVADQRQAAWLGNGAMLGHAVSLRVAQ